MSETITLSPQFLQLHLAKPTALADELRQGLLRPQAQVSPKYLYDALGSRLFEAITELPEYYPTRTEAAIFAAQAQAIAETLGRGRTLVDLGAGNCEKAGWLFPLLQPERYVAVDISVSFLRGALACLQREHPQMPMLGLGMDFSGGLVLPPEVARGPRTLFYPGSSIGNFEPDAALSFLRDARAATEGGALLIGVDLLKPRELLEPAYDDPLGVTAAFNRNLLLHLNRLLGSDFQLSQWQHVGVFNESASRIEMHLQARQSSDVQLGDGQVRRFAAGERIHTESSYKWRLGDFEALLLAAGFVRPRAFTDERGWFAVWTAHA
jgi:L-histidine Nalpha-methyltransferase